jgi:integrase
MITSPAGLRNLGTRRAGIGHWHAHEGRHTAVSIMSNNGVPIQDIADTVGHKSTHVTETVYRHVIAPAITWRSQRHGRRVR